MFTRALQLDETITTGVLVPEGAIAAMGQATGAAFA
jgi:hypothetical protein